MLYVHTIEGRAIATTTHVYNFSNVSVREIGVAFP